MMKFLLPLAAIFLALASAYPGHLQHRLHHGVRPHLRTSRTLQTDIDEIIALIPIDEITAIGLNYLANDPEVQAAMAYAQSAEFHGIVNTVDVHPEYINFLSFLVSAGVDPYPMVNAFHELIGMEPITPPPMTRRHSRSIKSMFDEIVAIIPLADIQALVEKKLVESPEFKALYDKIGSPEFQSIVQTLQALPEYQLLKEKLVGYGIDVEAIISYFRNLFGLPASVAGKSARTLQTDIDEIIALIPIDEITAIGLNYLANDPEVQAAMAYAQSAEFHGIVNTVDVHPEYINFLSFLVSAGVDPYPMVNAFHELIGMEPITPPPMTRRHSRSIKSMFDEIVAIIPLADIQALVEKKLVESPEFKALYDKIGSPEFQSIVQTLQALPEYQLLKEKLVGYGIDVEAIISYFRNLFGLPASVAGKSARTLQTDIDEIIALIPIDEITAIGLNYLANDPEVQAAMAYAQSAEFHGIVNTVDVHPEYINFLSFLVSAGVDPYPMVNAFHELIGMEPITPPPMTRRHSRSIKSMFDEIVAIIPLADIQALVEKKLVESPEFKALYDKIGSPEFQSIVQTLQALPEYQLLKDKLVGYGIDVEAIISYFKNLFGLP